MDKVHDGDPPSSSSIALHGAASSVFVQTHRDILLFMNFFSPLIYIFFPIAALEYYLSSLLRYFPFGLFYILNSR